MHGMVTAKCELCKRESESLFIVSHKEFGRIRICDICLRHEEHSLLAHKSCSCC